MTWDAVDFADKTLMVISADKGGIPVRMVPLNSTILALLVQWYAEDKEAGIRHLIHYRGKPILKLQHGWNAAKRRAGITRRIRPYDLRHRCATDMLEAGADAQAVSQILGHKNIAMTMRYQHVSSSMKRKAVDSLG